MEKLRQIAQCARVAVTVLAGGVTLLALAAGIAFFLFLLVLALWSSSLSDWLSFLASLLVGANLSCDLHIRNRRVLRLRPSPPQPPPVDGSGHCDWRWTRGLYLRVPAMASLGSTWSQSPASLPSKASKPRCGIEMKAALCYPSAFRRLASLMVPPIFSDGASVAPRGAFVRARSNSLSM